MIKHRGQCDCLPTWLRQKDTPPDCIHCSKPFEKKDCMFLCRWLYPCSNNKTRTHSITVPLHEQCTFDYQKHMAENGYDRFVDRCVGSLDEMPREMAQKMADTCRENHHPLQSRCANCRVVKQKETDFFKCSCKTVSYCCKACQLLDWKKHNKTCTFKYFFFTHNVNFFTYIGFFCSMGSFTF